VSLRNTFFRKQKDAPPDSTSNDTRTRTLFRLKHRSFVQHRQRFYGRRGESLEAPQASDKQVTTWAVTLINTQENVHNVHEHPKGVDSALSTLIVQNVPGILQVIVILRFLFLKKTNTCLN